MILKKLVFVVVFLGIIGCDRPGSSDGKEISAVIAPETISSTTAPPHVDDLIQLRCEGTLYMPVEGGSSLEVASPRTFLLSRSGGESSVESLFGKAVGVLDVSAHKYTGNFMSARGVSYVVLLDRISGQLVQSQRRNSGELGRLEYVGECDVVEPKF